MMNRGVVIPESLRTGRSLFIASGFAAGGGLVGLTVFSISGLRCPFRSVGLACPGCGCGRALASFVDGGPVAMWRNQPTATLFLTLWVIAVGFTAIAHLVTGSTQLRRQAVSMGWLFIAIGAITNLLYQLAQ